MRDKHVINNRSVLFSGNKEQCYPDTCWWNWRKPRYYYSLQLVSRPRFEPRFSLVQCRVLATLLQLSLTKLLLVLDHYIQEEMSRKCVYSGWGQVVKVVWRQNYREKNNNCTVEMIEFWSRHLRWTCDQGRVLLRSGFRKALGANAKSTVVPTHSPRRIRKVVVHRRLFLTWRYMVTSGQIHAPIVLPPGK